MVEQMLDLDGVARRQRKCRQQAAHPVGQAKPPFGRELMKQGRGHHLADRADLEQRIVGDRRARVGIGETEVERGGEAVGRGQPEREAGQVEIAAVRFTMSADRGKRARKVGARLRERGQAERTRQRGGQCATRKPAPAKMHELSLPFRGHPRPRKASQGKRFRPCRIASHGRAG